MISARKPSTSSVRDYIFLFFAKTCPRVAMVVDHPLHWVKACKWLSHLLVELVSRQEDRMHLSTVSSVPGYVLLLLVTRHPLAAQVHFLTAARASTDALAAILRCCAVDADAQISSRLDESFECILRLTGLQRVCAAWGSDNRLAVNGSHLTRDRR